MLFYPRLQKTYLPLLISLIIMLRITKPVSFLILLIGLLILELGIAQPVGQIEGLPACPIGEGGAPALENPGIASGGLCRGACGIDCPSDRCEGLGPHGMIGDFYLYMGDFGDHELYCVYPSTIECKTHKGCRDHDACYDQCAENGYKDVTDKCHLDCNQKCYDNWSKCQCAAWADILPSALQLPLEQYCEPKFDGKLKFFWGSPRQELRPKGKVIPIEPVGPTEPLSTENVWFLVDKKADVDVREDNTDYYFNRGLSFAGTSFRGALNWKDGPGPKDCHGFHWGESSWSELPGVLEPGKEKMTTLKADSGGDQSCSCRWAGADVWLFVDDWKMGEVDHSQHTCEEKEEPIAKDFWWEVPKGKIGDTLTIAVVGSLPDFASKAVVTYTYSYQAKLSDVTPYSYGNEAPQFWGIKAKETIEATETTKKPPAKGVPDWVREKIEREGEDSGVKISAITGQVDIRPHSDEDAWRGAGLKSVIKIGDHIRTGEDSRVILSFPDGTTFEMKPESEIIIDERTERDSKLALVAGKIWTNVKKMVRDGTMEVQMSQAVAGIKGTIIVCEETGFSSILNVLEGQAYIRSRFTGEERLVNAGEMVIATQDGLSPPQSFDIESEKASWKSAVEQAPPTGIEGLKLWLDGSDLNGDGINPADGSFVSQWTDKSGLGHDAINSDSSTQPTYVANAVNSRGGVNFGLKDNDFLETAGTTDFNFNSASIFIVANHGESAAHMDIATSGYWDDEFLIYDQDIYHQSSTSNYRAVGFSDPPSGFYIQLGLFGRSASDLENMINGEVSTTTTATDGTPLDYTSVSRAATIGWRQGHLLPVENFDGTICEVIVYDHKLSRGEQNAIVAWLEEKYGIDADAVE
jgi:hypothetical protein